MSAKHTPTPLLKAVPVNDVLPYLGPSNVDSSLVDIKGEAIGYIFERDRAEYICRTVNSHEALLEAAKTAKAILEADESPRHSYIGGSKKRLLGIINDAIAQAEAVKP